MPILLPLAGTALLTIAEIKPCVAYNNKTDNVGEALTRDPHELFKTGVQQIQFVFLVKFQTKTIINLQVQINLLNFCEITKAYLLGLLCLPAAYTKFILVLDGKARRSVAMKNPVLLNL